LLYNILILNYEYPPLGGGAGIITSHLANEFTDAGHKVFVLTSCFEGLPEEEVTGNLTIKRLHTRRARLDRSNVIEMYSYMRIALKYVKKEFKEGQFDVCLANFTLPGGIVGLKMKKELNLPYAMISHGHDIPWFYPKQMFFWHLAMYPIIKKVCLGSGRNILLTPEMKQIADRFVGNSANKRNVIIPNGIHEQELDYDEKPSHIFKILFASRLVDQKNPMLFMRTMLLLKQQGLKFEATVLGGGALMDKLIQFKNKYGLNEVTLKGKVSHNEVVDHMKLAHVLMAPSTHEAMSVTILEALSCGVYVVTTPISGNMRIPEENGCLVDARSPEPFATKITRFYIDNFSKGHLHPREVPEDLLQHFNWQVVSEHYVKVFDEIIEEFQSN